MDTITFGKVVENAPVGAELFRINFRGDEEVGYWTGRTLTLAGSELGYVFNATQKCVVSCRTESETDWRIRVSNVTGTTVTVSDKEAMFIEAIGDERVSYLRTNDRLMRTQSEFDAFKKNASESLCEWASNADLSEGEKSDFNQVMEDIGLEGIKRDYTVIVSVTYSVQFTVTGASEDAVREEVENNLSDYIYDSIDTSYYEDYTIESIDED